MLTEKDYCDYDTCIALKKLGLKWDCDENDMLECKAARPSLYITQKWLREEKDIIIYPEKNSIGWFYTTHYNIGKVHRFKYSEEYYDSYEEALSEGIKEAVKTLKEVKKSDNTSVKFTSILRLIEIIPSNIWNQDNRGRVYAEKLANILEREGYSEDAKLIREKIQQMNGENVPLAIID